MIYRPRNREASKTVTPAARIEPAKVESEPKTGDALFNMSRPFKGKPMPKFDNFPLSREQKIELAQWHRDNPKAASAKNKIVSWAWYRAYNALLSRLRVCPAGEVETIPTTPSNVSQWIATLSDAEIMAIMKS